MVLAPAQTELMTDFSNYQLRALYAAASHVEAEQGRTIAEIKRGAGIDRKKWRHIKDKMMALGASGEYGTLAIQVKYEQGMRFSKNSDGGDQEAEDTDEDQEEN